MTDLDLPRLNELFEKMEIARTLAFGRSPFRNGQVCSVRGERLLAFENELLSAASKIRS